MATLADTTYHERILVVGGKGKIASGIIPRLDEKYGSQNVLVADKDPIPAPTLENPYRYYSLDITSSPQISDFYRNLDESGVRVSTVFNLASLSASQCSKYPDLANYVMHQGLEELATLSSLHGTRLFFNPSSVAVIGSESDDPFTQDSEVMLKEGDSLYKEYKLFSEEFGAQVNARWDMRYVGIRYPGVLSHQFLPENGFPGTTKIFNEIAYHALKGMQAPTCAINPFVRLPLATLETTSEASIGLLESDDLDNINPNHLSRLNMVEGRASVHEYTTALKAKGCDVTVKTLFGPDVYGRDKKALAWSKDIEMEPNVMPQVLKNLTLCTDAKAFALYAVKQLSH
tara:strand:+ start:2192 stop:3223 length:1032 start_codon:yes stop_codon:yes gene_type:complete